MRYYYLGTSERTHSRGYGRGVCPGRPHGVLLSYKSAGSVVLLQKPWKSWAPTRMCAHTPYIAPSISSIWLFLNCITYNKPTLENGVPSWVLIGFSSELSNWTRGCGNPWTLQLVSETYGWPRTWIWNLKWGQSCGIEPFNLWTQMFTPGH